MTPYKHPTPEAGTRWLLSRLGRHMAELGRLAPPVIASRVGILLLPTLDIVMLGPLGAEEVGRYQLGTSPFIVLMVFSIGLLFGTMIETSQKRGEGKWEETGAVWRRAMPYALLIGAVMTGATFLAEGYFLLTGQTARLAELGAPVTIMHGVGMIPMLLYVTCSFFLEGIGRPFPVLLAIVVANGMNIIANLALIGGVGDLIPAMGAEGAALGSSLSRACMAIYLVVYIWYLKDRDTLKIREAPEPGWIRGGQNQRRAGYAAGLSFGFESFAFAAMTTFAGWLGEEALTIFGVGMNLTSMLFMGALGIASATSVRVGVAHGRRDWRDRSLAGWTGVLAAILLITPFSLVLGLAPAWVAGVYQLADPALAAAAIPVIAFLAIVAYGDGCQIVLGNALRGAGDAWVPTVINFFTFLIAQIALGWYLAIEMGNGVIGLFEGVGIAAALTIALQIARWTWLSLNPPK